MGESSPTQSARLSVVGNAGPVVFQDAALADADWAVDTYVAGNGGSATGVQATMGGNPDSFRLVTIRVNAAPGPGLLSSVYRLHWKVGAVYYPESAPAPNPIPISSIDYAQDAKLVTRGGQGQGTALAL
jgi:hypothetical protein